jgi:cytochrome c-type biogenesis protein CcmH
MIRYVFMSFIVFFISMHPAFALEETLYPFTSITEATRFYELIKEIRCVVCQNQTIADSNAPLAKDLREKIYGMVVEKKSEEEIKDYLVQRYGEFILFKPRFNKLTMLLWLFPFLGLSCLIFLFLRFTTR